MTRPTVGLLVDRPPPPQLAQLITDLHRWCRPITPDPGAPTPAAWIATSAALLGPDHTPAAVWSDETVDSAVVLNERVLTATRSFDVPWMSPYVRRRFRQARGLPDDLFVDASTLPEHVRGTAFALASVVDVTGPVVLDALAWGAPCITDATTAAEFGIEDRVHALVGDVMPDDIDARLAASLSWNGRQLVEQKHDRVAAARRVAAALGLLDPLDELATPRDSRVRDRLEHNAS